MTYCNFLIQKILFSLTDEERNACAKLELDSLKNDSYEKSNFSGSAKSIAEIILQNTSAGASFSEVHELIFNNWIYYWNGNYLVNLQEYFC